MIVYGASGHGKVIIELLEVNGITDIEIWDDSDKAAVWQYAVKKPSLQGAGIRLQMILGIGNNLSRKKVAEKYASEAAFITTIHPSAIISNRATVAAGTAVMAGVTVNTDTRIGKHCIVNTSASIDHDCFLENFVHISPNATLSGNVNIGEGTHVGAGAAVIQGITIGKWCTIGAGAVIIKNVPDFSTVVGNPGRIIKTSNSEE